MYAKARLESAIPASFAAVVLYNLRAFNDLTLVKILMISEMLISHATTPFYYCYLHALT